MRVHKILNECFIVWSALVIILFDSKCYLKEIRIEVRLLNALEALVLCYLF